MVPADLPCYKIAPTQLIPVMRQNPNEPAVAHANLEIPEQYQTFLPLAAVRHTRPRCRTTLEHSPRESFLSAAQ
jgi:hypothetical protein